METSGRRLSNGGGEGKGEGDYRQGGEGEGEGDYRQVADGAVWSRYGGTSMRHRPISAVMLGRRHMQWANDGAIFGNPANTGHSPNAV